MEEGGIYALVRHYSIDGHSYPFRCVVKILENGALETHRENQPTNIESDKLEQVVLNHKTYNRVTLEQMVQEVQRRKDVIAAFRYEG